MAPFNPQIGPTQDPNYMGYSRPISQPDADKGLSSVIAGLGDVVNTGAKGADAYIARTTESEVYNQARAIQDQYIGELDAANKNPSASRDILPPPGANPDVPDEIASVGRQAEFLVSARANGKLSTTDYARRLNTLAKDYRSMYPEYKEVIDKAIASATGMDPANTLVRSLTADLNAAAAAANSGKNSIERYLLSHMDKVPDGDKWYSAFKRGLKTEDQALEYFQKNMIWKNEADRIETQRRLNTGTREEMTAESKILAREEVYRTVSNRFEMMDIGIGQTPAQTKQIVADIISGKKQLTDAEVQVMIPAMHQGMANMKQEMMAKLNQRREGNLPSHASLLGKDAEEIVDQAINSTFGSVTRLLENKEYGLAFRAPRIISAMAADTKKTLFNDQDIGEYARLLEAAKDWGPGAHTELFKSLLTQKGLSEALGAYVERNITRATVPPRPGETKPTLADDLEDMKRRGVNDPRAHLATIETATNGVMNPKLGRTERTELAKYLFDPKNANILAKYKMDYVNPQGKAMPGKYRVYEYLASRSMSEAVKSLGDPTLAAQYQNWATNEFGNQLFRTEIQNLSDLRLREGVKVYYKDGQFGMIVNGDPNYLMKPDQGPDQTIPQTRRGPDGQLQYSPQDQLTRETKRSLNRLNWGLRQLNGVAETFGTKDTDAYLMQVLMSSGFDPSKASQEMDVPQGLVNSIYGSRREELAKRMRQRQLEEERAKAKPERGF